MTHQKQSAFVRFFKSPDYLIFYAIVGVAIYFGIKGMDSKSVTQWLVPIFVALTAIATAQLLFRYASFRRDSREEEIFEKFTERLNALEERDKKIIELLEKKRCKFFTDISLTWNKAIEMVEKVPEGGYVYDSSSIKNRDIYEEAIEKKCAEKVEIMRVICTNDFQKESRDFINTEYANATNISISHLPYSIPFDVLITHFGNNVEAIIGFRTSINNEKYTSALYIFDNEFAHQILSIYNNVFLNDVHQAKGEIDGCSDVSCNICKDIEKLSKH